MATLLAFASCSNSNISSGCGWLTARPHAAQLARKSVAASRKERYEVRIVAQAEDEQDDKGPSQSPSGQPRLGSILKNKQRILQAQLSSLQDSELEQRLSSVKPYASPYRLLDTIAGQLMQGKTTVVAEIARLSPSETMESFSKRCVEYVAWGADALAICTDEEKSPNGAMDLATACKAVKVPVLRKDWIIHPLQVAETREAGASSLTAVYSILRKGMPAILQYAVSLGLDAVVEVVNLQELQEVAPIGVPLFGINLSIGLSLKLPGLRQDIAKSLVGEIPFGATSLVGVWSIDEARRMKLEGADAVYVRHEVLQGRGADGSPLVPQTFLENLVYAMTGDD